MSVVVERAVIYAEKPGYRALELDIHRDVSSETPLPLLVNVHGGGWRVSNRQRAPRETRAWNPSFHERLAAAGFVVACPSYRLSAEALYPAAIDDVADAVAFLRDTAASFAVDPDRVVLFGQSAGGYLATAVGLAARARWMRGIACWYPLTDFSELTDDESAAIFPSQWLGAPLSAVATLVEQSRLARLAHGDAPPVLLQHGTADTMAPFAQSELLHAALAASGASVELEVVEGAEHFFGGASDAAVEAVFQRTVAFLQRCVA